jgi:hypothetical protein
VSEQAAALSGTVSNGFAWPETYPTPVTVSLRVPARLVATGVRQFEHLDAEWYVAQHGVGVIEAGLANVDIPPLDRVRRWAESHGGSLVVMGPGLSSFGRWGAPPSSLQIQRRMKNLFDPSGVCHPGALPGGL